tara:strand:+ start:28 stop:522 length:495 start_codon:yes stop_codon:yes gene_type:complete
MVFLMMKLKEKELHLIAKMKNISYLLIFIFLASCTSNTIFEKPKDIIPKDTMSLLIQEMMIASSAKYVKNKNLEKKIEYMFLVYNQFKIDSVRFQTSNLYYMSKIDVYQEIFRDAKVNLEKQKKIYEKINNKRDSLKSDSLNQIRALRKKKPEKFNNLKVKPTI